VKGELAFKIGINGFGRIGRLVFRALWGWLGLELVQLSDPAVDAQSAPLDTRRCWWALPRW
jgi:glyceraldehyde-3-phosphate dehydrogenase/erythrose-4-phosphate dehydrogenase